MQKKYHCKGIAEIVDLWPYSLIVFQFIGKSNPVLPILYAYEKHMYKIADSIIFTMEGGIDYLCEKKWDKVHGGQIDTNKVYHINNGVDIEEFNLCKERYKCSDKEMNNPNTFKIVYAGSVRLVNHMHELVRVAEILQKSGKENIKIIIWGEGDQIERISTMINENS